MSRDGKTTRKIRKKQTSTKTKTIEQVVKANENFCVGEQVFARVAYKGKDLNGKTVIKWASAPRQEVENRDALEGIVALLFAYADEYNKNDFGPRSSELPEGFDFEKTLESEFYEVQQLNPKKKRRKKKVKKLRGARSRNK